MVMVQYRGRSTSTWRWTTAFFALLVVTLAAAPAQARWLRAESARFIVYSDGDERRLRNYGEELESFDGVLRDLHELSAEGPPPRKLEVFLVGGKEALKRTAPAMDHDVAGYYSASARDVFVVAIRDEAVAPSPMQQNRVLQDYRESIVFHEYTHHFMLQYFPNAYPGWLIEGYAEYFGTAIVRPEEVDIGRASVGRVRNLVQEEWTPLATVLGANSRDLKSQRERAMYYAEAWLLTHYLISDPERYKALQAYMREVAGGADPVKAMEAALGQDASTLQKTLRTYLMNNPPYRQFKRKAAETTAVTITAMPPSADALLLDSVALRHPEGKETRELVLGRLRAEAPRFAGDRLADISLAHAELNFGDHALAETMLQRRVAADPKDAEALALAAEARMDEAQKEADPDKGRALAIEAQTLFARSYALNPDRYQTLWLYARIRRKLDGPAYPSENTLTALKEALALAPQVAGIRLQTSRGLFRRGRYDEAEALLAPLLNDPHSPDTAEEARGLRSRIEAARATKSLGPALEDTPQKPAA